MISFNIIDLKGLHYWFIYAKSLSQGEAVRGKKNSLSEDIMTLLKLGYNLILKFFPANTDAESLI